MNFEKSDNWYVIQTKPSQEDLASFNLSGLGLEILNPKLKEEKRVWGCVKPIIKPLFAGYIFAKFNAVKYFHTIQYTRGVKQVLHFGMTLFPVEEEIIQSIKNRLNSDGFVEQPKKHLKPGSTVSISEGPLSGFNGVFERETSDKKRVVILLDMMGVRAQVEMEKYYLKAAA
jgi:transcription elongation factor/antiterminator RfaH